MQIETLTNTGATLQTIAPEQQRKLWSSVADTFEANEDPFQSMEGGPENIIETITDLSKGRGHIINFGILGRIYNKAKMGEERFTAATDFAKVVLGNDELRVDFVRNASNESLRTEQHMGMVGEILSHVPKMLGEWWGWWKSVNTQMIALHKINDENRVIAGNKSSVHDLVSSDTLSWDETVDLGSLLEPMGGKPAYVGQDADGNSIFANAVVATVPALAALKKDPVYKANVKDAGEVGKTNKLFAGGVTHVDGHAFMKFRAMDHADEGPIGCALSPKGRLGNAISAGTGALAITGGGSATKAALTHIEYTLFFPKYAYRFLYQDALATDAPFWELTAEGTFYVTVVNPRNAPTDRKKFCIYECSANDGNKLTVSKRLGPTTTGIANTTVGGITWDVNKHTQTHPEGALFYLSTSYGLPLFASVMMAQRAIRRGYGLERNKRTEDTDEGGFGKYTYIRSVFGQAVRKDRDGRIPGIAVLIHTGTYEGWNCPTRS